MSTAVAAFKFNGARGITRSLLILDNVRDDAQWNSDGFLTDLPAVACCRLVTTKSRYLADVPMIVAERLADAKGFELLAKRRSDAAHPDNAAAVRSIVRWFEGWAVALTVVGIYMRRRASITWDSYAKSLIEGGFKALIETEKNIGNLPDYRVRVDAVLGDMLLALSPFELRLVQYAAILPQDHVIPQWLKALLLGETDLTIVPRPGIEDEATAAIDELRTEQLLVKVSEEFDILSLHSVVRQSLLDALRAEDALHGHLREHVLSARGVSGRR